MIKTLEHQKATINLKIETRKVRGRSRTLYSDKWLDLEALKRMEKIKSIKPIIEYTMWLLWIIIGFVVGAMTRFIKFTKKESKYKRRGIMIRQYQVSTAVHNIVT